MTISAWRTCPYCWWSRRTPSGASSSSRWASSRSPKAGNGREAAERIAESHNELVIADYNKPEMDGQAMVNYIRQLSEQPHLPVLMVTSERDAARLSTVRQAGVSALCDKPFDVTTLHRITRDLLNR